jgi:hypothetical protein
MSGIASVGSVSDRTSGVDACTLYQRILGADFERLPPSLRELHARSGVQGYAGEAEASRGAGRLSRLCGWIAGLPPAHAGAIEVEIDADRHGETWIRRFGDGAMRSRLRERDGLIQERLGPMAFAFALELVDDGVIWRLRSVHALGLPLPLHWFDGMRAHEFEHDGRYRFDVRAALPGVGLLVHYRGWLAIGD